jgi:hypothetical protein
MEFNWKKEVIDNIWYLNIIFISNFLKVKLFRDKC